MALNESLNSFRDFLLSIGHPAIKMLNGGIDQQNIDLFFLSKGIDIVRNDDLYTLYGWGNGVESSEEVMIGEMIFFNDGIFLSLEDAIMIYQEYVHNRNIWDKKLFPLFTSGGGDYLLIDLEQTSPTYNMIHFYSPPILFGDRTVAIYDSLDNLFISVLTCYKQGAYFLDDNLLDSNNEIHDICLRLNPLSEFWRA